MFTLDFETHTSAFDENHAGEVSRILRDIAEHIEHGYMEQSVMDHNGNCIGQYCLNRE